MLQHSYLLRCSSVIVEECAIVRGCQGIGRIRVMCKVGIIDYSVCGTFSGG
jgi:hypothetical protein